MRRYTKTFFGLMLAAAMVGCGDQLVVENENSPDRDRALARPGDVENLASTQFRVLHNASWTTGGIQPMVGVMGYENYSSNANFGMGSRSGIPRSLIDNGRGGVMGQGYSTWSILQQVARAEALTLGRMNRTDFTFFPTSEAQRQRARAFAFFVKGIAMGYTALLFDSGPVLRPDDDLALPNALVGYDSLMLNALADLDTAIAIALLPASAIPGANGFPLPPTWLPTPNAATGVTATLLVQLARSYKARFRANVARTPAERGAVNWALVIADANAGVPADFQITLSNVTGGWFYSPSQKSTYQNWHQEWAGILGMADTSGAFDAWLNTSQANKQPFLVLTNDLRFPSGTTRATQNASSGCTTGATCTPPGTGTPVRNANQWYRNRLAGQDVQVDGLYYSFYDFDRDQGYYNNNNNGNLPFIALRELNMLAAEGYIRTNNYPLALGLINTSRTARGLPALPGTMTTVADLIPGPSCVPRVPVGPRNATNGTPTATACGNIMEAMKWEKRMETQWTFLGSWYFDGRGWGDLPYGTPVQFPVPYTELDARGEPIYHAPSTFAGADVYTAAERLSNSTTSYGYGIP